MPVMQESEAALGVVRIRKALEMMVAPVKGVTIGKLASADLAFEYYWKQVNALTLEQIDDALKENGPKNWMRKFMKMYFPQLHQLYSIWGSDIMTDRASRLLYMGHELIRSVEFQGKRINLQQPVIDLALAVNQTVAESGPRAISIDVIGLYGNPAKQIERVKQEPLWIVVFAGAVTRDKRL